MLKPVAISVFDHLEEEKKMYIYTYISKKHKQTVIKFLLHCLTDRNHDSRWQHNFSFYSFSHLVLTLEWTPISVNNQWKLVCHVRVKVCDLGLQHWPHPRCHTLSIQDNVVQTKIRNQVLLSKGVPLNIIFTEQR